MCGVNGSLLCKGIEGAAWQDAAFCRFIAECEKQGLRVQLFALLQPPKVPANVWNSYAFIKCCSEGITNCSATIGEQTTRS